jgi:hypothetical protein
LTVNGIHDKLSLNKDILIQDNEMYVNTLSNPFNE